MNSILFVAPPAIDNEQPVPTRDTSGSRRRRIIGHATLSLAFLAGYLVLAKPDVILVSNLGFTAWYPPVGLSMALLLGISPWYAPLVCFSNMLAGALIYHQPVLSWSGTLGALATASLYAIAAWVLRGHCNIDFTMKRQRDVLRYLSVTLLAASSVTAVNVMCLVADHTISRSQYPHAAFMWFAGDAVALVAVAPFALIYLVPAIRARLFGLTRTSPHGALRLETNKAPSVTGIIEAFGQVASIALVLWVMFGRSFRPWEFFYLAFLPILWISMRQGIGQAVNGILAFNFGVVVALDLVPTSLELLTRISLLMLVVSATGLVVGSAVSERHLVGRELLEHSTFLNALIENSPLGIVVLDREGHVRLCNDAFEKLFLFSREELVGKNLDSFFSSCGGTAEARQVTAEVAAGRGTQRSLRRARKDGCLIDVELNAVPLVLGKHVQGSFGIYKNISEEIRAAEEMKRNSEALNGLVGELQLRTNQITLLNEMSGLLQSCTTTNEAYAVVGQFARKLFPVATAGVLYVFGSSRTILESVSHWGQTSVSEATFPTNACWGLRRSQANWSEYPSDSIICAHLKNTNPASYLCAPMIAQGEALGILHLQYDRSESTRGSEVFETLQESQKRLAISVSGQIALALANLQMRETLQEQSVRDPLTGLFNRRFMEESLNRELQGAKRSARSLALALIDLDHFKNFNDTFGHEVGDQVLQAMADLFRVHFRSNDLICRYGGEEFAAILPESTAEEAAKRADELRSRASMLTLRHEGRLIDPVTLSIGIAAFPEDGGTAAEILRVADTCLYESKRKGRDCVSTPRVGNPGAAKVVRTTSSVMDV